MTYFDKVALSESPKQSDVYRLYKNCQTGIDKSLSIILFFLSFCHSIMIIILYPYAVRSM